jgi:hypothetical protein
VLTSLLGIRLVLWTGATIPSPPDRDVMASLVRVKVTNDARLGDGFQLTFAAAKRADGSYDLVSSSAFDPLNRVWVGVVMGAVPEVLVDGVITQTQLEPSNQPGLSTFMVTGTGLSLKLDLEERAERYPNQPDSVIVTQLLAGYPELGLVPVVTPTTDVPIEVDRVPRQRGTDLDFIHKAAGRNGFVFRIEPVTFGVNTAYWGPDNRIGLPQPALSINLGASTNVRRLTFGNDALAPVGAKGSFIEPIAKLRVPIPSLPPLRLPPLAASAVPAARTELLADTANANPAQALLASQAVATRAAEPLTAEGELDSIHYGTVLRARRPVGVRGAGLQHDGNWQVTSVTHEITKGRYSQQFALAREGTGALLPVVRP